MLYNVILDVTQYLTELEKPNEVAFSKKELSKILRTAKEVCRFKLQIGD